MSRCVLFSICLLFLSIIQTYGGEITITGKNPEYANQEVTFFTYKNQITFNEQKIVSFRVDSLGNFKTVINTNQIEFIFAHMGVFFAFLYVEPGNTYHIGLPPQIPKKQEEKLNPFFEETRLHLLVHSVNNNTGYNELNRKIGMFSLEFDSTYTQSAVKSYTQQNTKQLDSVITSLQIRYADSTHNYYSNFYYYRIGLLKFSTARLKSRYVSDNWFLNKPVLYFNPAYMELFNQVYDKYFVFFGRTKNGKKLYSDINTNSSYYQLKQTLAQDDVLNNDTLKELVILKGIYDGFYGMDFSRNSLLKILDSLITTTKIDIHKAIGIDVRQSVTKLLSGYPAPPFQLYNSEHKLKNIESFKGKYIYLNFATTQNYACLKELELLKRVQEKYNKYITVVTISVDENASSTFSYARKKEYTWPFLHYGNQPDIIRDYDIRIFPTYYLIDGNGKLVWSHAPSPAENFDTKLFEELRAKGIL